MNRINRIGLAMLLAVIALELLIIASGAKTDSLSEVILSFCIIIGAILLG